MSELTVGSLSGLSSNSFVIGVQPGSQLAVDGLTTLDGTPAYRYVTTLYYTSSGTFTKASYPWLRAIRVKCQAAGGGGGGCPATSSTLVGAGKAGAGGAYAESFITDISGLSSSVTVTRGAGGTGGTAGNNSGSTGGNSSFGAIVSATGGPLGGTGDFSSSPIWNGGGQFGATTGIGDLIIPGGSSENSFSLSSNVVIGGAGGASFMGQGQRGVLTWNSNQGGNGSPGVGYGSGGGSGVNSQSTATARAGGNGANGIVMVELYA
jgi:hypothetical protein